MKQKQTKKVLSFILAVFMIFTALPISSISVNAGTDSPVEILYNSEKISSIMVAENEEITLESKLYGIRADTYHWQIKAAADQDLWVNIDGYTHDSCEVNYALVGSLLDQTDTAYLRLAVTSSETTYYSNSVAVGVSYVVITPYEAELDTSVPDLKEVSASGATIKGRGAGGKSRGTNDGTAAIEEGELVTYDITVNFLYQGGVEVTQANKANKEAGGSHQVTIEVPSAAGYAPYYDADGDGELEKLTETNSDGKIIFQIAIENISKDETYNIWYLPDYVTYTVNHYFQNQNNEGYTIKKTETRQGFTGSLVSSDLYLPEDEAVGYSPYAYAQSAIAADGTTVINIYYHINFYYVEYDLGEDAFGVEPLYVRYETVVTVKEPTRHGYHFEGWELVGYDGAEPTEEQKILYDLNDGSVAVPAANLKYAALWSRGNTVYTVVYWREAESKAGSNQSVTYEYWGSQLVGGYYTQGGHWESDNSVQAGLTVNASDFSEVPSEISTRQITTSTGTTTLDESIYFTYNQAKSQETSTYTVAGDGTTVVNVYFDRKEYTLKFYYAAEHTSGGDTVYNVVGGTTYYFGASALSNTDKTSEVALFSQYFTSGNTYSKARDQVGTVDELPALNEKGEKRGYTVSFDSTTINRTEYKLHYISFTAKYNADISEMWPTDVFNSVTRTNGGNNGSWTSREAFASAWNGEYNVYYTQLHKNDNQTIKGKYNKLGYQILWNSTLSTSDGREAGDGGAVAYLCFWENGADVDWSVPELYRYNIYLECLDQTNHTDKGAIQKTFNGTTKWYYPADSYDTVDDSDVNNQTIPPIYGFTNVGGDSNRLTAGRDYDSSLYAEGYDVNFYYDRTRYTLEFNNEGVLLELTGTGGLTTVRYGVSLYSDSGYALDDFRDADGNLLYYPKTLDPGGYEFEGWYTSSTFASSTRFDFTANPTMPASDLILYAHWVPVMHNVTLYLDKTAAETDGTRLYENTVQVQHGGLAPTPRQDYENGDLIFVGWFYLDSSETNENGQPVEKAFSFEAIPVVRDMNIYAKWTSEVPREYTVYYRYYLDDGTYVDIAPSTTGTALQGTSITVNAKVGDQLNSPYRVGYFPEKASHSITVTAENNIYVFEYLLVAAVPYTVQYVDVDGNELLQPKVVNHNRYTVVTEKFMQIDGYLPDHYSIELTVASGGENVITFVYTPNTTDAYYKIVHYTQNVSGDSYTEYKSTENAGRISSTVSDSILDIVGFQFTKATITVGEATSELTPSGNTVSGEITSSGLLIEIYYDRLAYSYTVEYREYDSTAENSNGKALTTAKTVDNVLYGTVVTENALTIAGYTLVSQTPQSEVIGGDDQVIVFHYSEKNIGITYVALNGGRIDREQESVAAVTGHPLGSTATADTGYKFVGWYRNALCTLPVDPTWVHENNQLVPEQANGLYQETTYYALFERATADLYIFTDFPANNNYQQIDSGTTFIFEIKGIEGTSTQDIDLTVALHERDSITVKDLPVGDYRITQLVDWSWRYTPLRQTYRDITVSADASTDPNDTDGNWVRFTNSRTDQQWLDDYSYSINIFDGD